MTASGVILALIALLGVLLLLRCGRRVRQRRILAASRSGMGGSLCLALAAVATALLLNLHTYTRLTHEQAVAQIRFAAIGAQQYRAMLTTADDRLRIIDLNGDEWQLDARVLKWRAWANLLGLDARYRLERISGRYRNVADETDRPRSVIALHDNDRGLDALAVVQRLPDWAAFVDAQYGSATFLPMADGATYAITLSQSGLVARPSNDAARAAIRRW